MSVEHGGYRMWGEADTPWKRDMARDILALLDTAYPGHPWKVMVYGDATGGGYFIQHLEFDGRPYGENNPQAHLCGSASEFKVDVLNRGGAILERVFLARGRRNLADRVTRMDGVPESGQPRQFKAPVEAPVVLDTSFEPLREEPRPQALRGSDGN